MRHTLTLACIICAMSAFKFYSSFDFRQLSTAEDWTRVFVYSSVCGLSCAIVYANTSSGVFNYLEMNIIPSLFEVVCICWTFLVFLGAVTFSWPLFLIFWPLCFTFPQIAGLLWIRD